MPNLRNLIPSANSLFTFEAAARLSSFTKAAAELNVTQAAVSYAIKRLETFMDVRLFHREYRKITLTDVGQKFFTDVSLGLSHIQQSATEISQRYDHVRDRAHVTISISTAFAGYWMLPRLPDWRTQYPNIDLRLQTSDRDVDLTSEGITLGIRRGRGDWMEYDAMLFGEEEVYPICSPDFCQKYGQLSEPSDLLNVPLIIFNEAFRNRLSWQDWLHHFGVDQPLSQENNIPTNDYALTVHAAIDGHGVALGWKHLTDGLIREGRLARPIPDTLKTGQGFYVVWAKDRPLSRDAIIVRDWLIRTAKQDFNS